MKILSIDEMIAASWDCSLPTYAAHIAAMEAAATALAKDLADHLGIGVCAGTRACFYPLKPTDPCPAVIEAGDVGGDWEFV